MVRALKWELSGTGTYFNLSQGVFVTLALAGGNVAAPLAPPTDLTARSERSAWLSRYSDGSSGGCAGGVYDHGTQQEDGPGTWGAPG